MLRAAPVGKSVVLGRGSPWTPPRGPILLTAARLQREYPTRMGHVSLHRILSITAVVLFPVLTIGFVLAFLLDRPWYRAVLDEDGPVENLTPVALIAVAVLAVCAARRFRRRRWHPFYLVLAALCVFGALDEISWGQRIVGFESPAFFKKYSRQEETNVHNVFQKFTTLKVKDLTPPAFIGYGVILPWLARRSRRVAALVERLYLVLSPRALIGCWILGSIFMLDRPTGREEEIGELFLSVGMLLLVALKLTEPTGAPAPPRPVPGHR